MNLIFLLGFIIYQKKILRYNLDIENIRGTLIKNEEEEEF